MLCLALAASGWDIARSRAAAAPLSRQAVLRGRRPGSLAPGSTPAGHFAIHNQWQIER